MDALDEAKELMYNIGCKKAFAHYSLNLSNIAEVKGCTEKSSLIELERIILKLDPIIVSVLAIDYEKPIECPLDASSNKYLEFSLERKTIIPNNISEKEIHKIRDKITSLLVKYNWSFL